MSCRLSFFLTSLPLLTFILHAPHTTALQALAVEKQRQEDANRNKLAAKQKALAQQKREHKAKAEKHKEVFGADYDDDEAEMDQYYDMEDVSAGVCVHIDGWERMT